ncbi:glycosyltransferase family 4 protein [Azospirillum sp.]|uniref:glycosyltransferase family 4 protein n=1 Tax=Azospirillum sp. TaxID=34012 RepID=UPI002D49D936|nr:glycosyltransferase family 4 protein [Azospirillum sp.]HYD69445.1 glycosyltransferase family 4 protein [Azospirillum sp.]
MDIALLFRAEGYSLDQTKLMGRHAAGAGFLQALARDAGAQDRLVCHAPDEKEAQAFARMVRQTGSEAAIGWVPFDQHARLAEAGCLFTPGPNIGDFAWRRLSSSGDRGYSLCGITHTTASHGAMEALGGLLTAPVRAWDAVICTSRAVRDTARHILEEQAAYLRWRLGADRFELPQLPLIPLGVDCDAYAYTAEPGAREAARRALGIADDELVVLFIGRLSFHAKAHPLPMYLALERAAAKLPAGRKVRLIQAGWFANQFIEDAFVEGARALCPSVTMTALDGRDAGTRAHAWAAADVFTSLSDNIQETFGLTPIEAMAAGLPVVVTDWDGYKDTVRDGIDGFRVPTVMPAAPLGGDLADRHDLGLDTYDMYCGFTSQLVSVDTTATEAAFDRLFADADLRRRLGEAGRERARLVYDWRHILGRYRELWDDLAERRRADPDLSGPAPVRRNPVRPDPFAAFAGYPTARLGLDHVVEPVAGADAAVLAERRALGIVKYAAYVFPSEAECEAVLAHLGRSGPTPVSELLALIPAPRRAAVMRGLVWMAKMDVVRLRPPAGG